MNGESREGVLNIVLKIILMVLLGLGIICSCVITFGGVLSDAITVKDTTVGGAFAGCTAAVISSLFYVLGIMCQLVLFIFYLSSIFVKKKASIVIGTIGLVLSCLTLFVFVIIASMLIPAVDNTVFAGKSTIFAIVFSMVSIVYSVAFDVFSIIYNAKIIKAEAEENRENEEECAASGIVSGNNPMVITHSENKDDKK